MEIYYWVVKDFDEEVVGIATTDHMWTVVDLHTELPHWTRHMITKTEHETLQAFGIRDFGCWRR